MSTPAGHDEAQIAPQLLPLTKATRNTYQSESDVQLRDAALRGYSLGTSLLAQAASADGASVKWVMRSIAIATLPDGTEVLLRNHRSSESAVATAIERDKFLASKILREAGVAAPRNIAVRSLIEAKEAWQSFEGPVVVKPRYGFKGRGITVGVNTPEALEAAFSAARRLGRWVVVEEFVDGEEFRVIASSDQSFGVLARVAPHVVGDGVSTIQQLVERKNALRMLNPNTCTGLISTNESMKRFLRSKKLDLGSIPALGEYVRVLGVSNFSQGGEAFECAEVLGPEVRRRAVEAVAAVPGLPWGAVDILVARDSGEAYVLEVNTDGGLGSHTYPSYGTPRNVAVHNWRIKRQAALEFASGASSRPSLDGGSQGVSNVAAPQSHDWARFGQARLSRYARDFLLRRGFTLRQVSSSCYVFFPAEAGAGAKDTEAHSEEWLVGALTLADKQGVAEAVGRFYMQRQMLAHKGVPRVEGCSTSKRSVCERRVEEYGTARVTGWRADWHGASSVVVQGKDDLSKLRWDRLKGVYVQQRPSGTRWRVLAGRDRSYVQFLVDDSGSATQSDLGQRLIEDLAVQAVRAFPELRWAGVDIVVPDDQSPVVEGMTLNPMLPSSMTLVKGGDLDSFFEEILPV